MIRMSFGRDPRICCACVITNKANCKSLSTYLDRIARCKGVSPTPSVREATVLRAMVHRRETHSKRPLAFLVAEVQIMRVDEPDWVKRVLDRCSLGLSPVHARLVSRQEQNILRVTLCIRRSTDDGREYTRGSLQRYNMRDNLQLRGSSGTRRTPYRRVMKWRAASVVPPLR